MKIAPAIELRPWVVVCGVRKISTRSTSQTPVAP